MKIDPEVLKGIDNLIISELKPMEFGSLTVQLKLTAGTVHTVFIETAKSLKPGEISTGSCHAQKSY